jgi:alpha-mannosidase
MNICRGRASPCPYNSRASVAWVDLTSADGSYGVALMSDCKYGWDKPSASMMRLTLIHTPYVSPGWWYPPYCAQRDFGPNKFRYAISGHQNDWVAGNVPWIAAGFNQPLIAFQTTSHDGPIGKIFSLLSVNTSQVAIRAVKKAEPETDQQGGDNEIIIRLQEITGQPANGVTVKLAGGIATAREVNGEEDEVGEAQLINGILSTELSPYQVRTFALTLSPPTSTLSPPSSQSVQLDYNMNVTEPDGSFDVSGRAFPAAQYPTSIISEDIKFDLTPQGGSNAMFCDGQTINLPNGDFNRLYFLAAAIGGDVTDSFSVNGNPVSLTIQEITGYVGQWYDSGERWIAQSPGQQIPFNVGETQAYIKRDTVAWYSSHLYQKNANNRPPVQPGYYDVENQLTDILAYEFGYMFMYCIDIDGASPTTLQLPENKNILVFALTLASNLNDETEPASVIYD